MKKTETYWQPSQSPSAHCPNSPARAPRSARRPSASSVYPLVRRVEMRGLRIGRAVGVGFRVRRVWMRCALAAPIGSGMLRRRNGGTRLCCFGRRWRGGWWTERRWWLEGRGTFSKIEGGYVSGRGVCVVGSEELLQLPKPLRC